MGEAPAGALCICIEKAVVLYGCVWCGCLREDGTRSPCIVFRGILAFTLSGYRCIFSPPFQGVS